MAFTTKKESKKQEYNVIVERAIATKNENIVIIVLNVNGVKINNCILKKVTVSKDGPKYKKGDECVILSFPSEKVKDNYYNLAWFPVTSEIKDDIVKQTNDLLDS
ncbi:MAG: hypothetical protein J6T10_14240 [Methanobrevibacter sp.]|nr:hypothetical protein [Methanobrevibacter sp.]